MHKLKLGLILFCFLAPTHQINAQHTSSGALGYSFDVPRLRPMQPPQDAVASFPLIGVEPQAQQWVDLAIDAAHGFWIDESERFLREALFLSPDHPMIFALLSFVHQIFFAGDPERGPYYFALARDALNRNPAYLDHHGQLWFHAISHLYPARPMNESHRWQRHRESLKDIVAQYPDDLEAKAFLALASWLDLPTRRQVPEEHERMAFAIDRLINDVLSVEPMHGVHHYKIHLWNNGRDDLRALNSARALGPAMPQTAHLWHMPAHIFANTGDFYYAWRHVEIAHRVDNEQLYRRELMPTHQHNYYHNFIDYGLALKAQLGQVHEASERLAAMLAHGRLPQPRSIAAHQRALTRLFHWLEQFELWPTILNFDEIGLSQGLTTSEISAADLRFKAQLLRWQTLAYLSQQHPAQAESKLSALSQVAASAWQHLDINDAKIIQTLSDDAHLHFELSFRDQTHAQRASLLSRLGELEITPGNKLGLLAFSLGFDEMASETFRVIESDQSATTPELFDLMYFWRKKSRNSSEPRVQSIAAKLAASLVPRSDIEDSLLGLRFAQSYPGETIRLINRARALHNRRVSELPPPFAYLEAYDHKAPEFKDPKHAVMKELESARHDANQFFASPSEGDFKLFVFSLGPNCEICNEQLSLLKEYSSEFTHHNIAIHYVHPDDSELEEFSSLADLDLEFFRYFGVWDEFSNEPLHAVVLIDHQRRQLWHSFSEHAVTDVSFLLDEAKRLTVIARNAPLIESLPVTLSGRYVLD